MTVTDSTVSHAIKATRRHLYALHNGEYNRLDGQVDDSETTFTFEFDMDGLTPGTSISVDDELVYVWSVNVSGKTAVVERGWEGTEAADHDSGAIIEVSPRFPQFAVRAALLDEIRSWGDQLYRIDTYSFSASSTTSAYDLPIDFLNIIDVRKSTTDTSGRWDRVTDYSIDRHADPTDFTSGVALYIQSLLPTTATIQVTFSAPFDLSYFEDDVDLIDDAGLTSSMLDIPPLGAAWRLLAPREAKRTFTEAQGEPRLAEEVTAGSTVRAAAAFKQFRDQRVDEETQRLIRKVPLRW